MRMIAMGGEALAEGFALLGFETFANPSPEDVEEVLGELLRRQENALVFLENGLRHHESDMLATVRREGGRIVVTEIPPLQAPADYRPPVEELVLRILGPSALEERT